MSNGQNFSQFILYLFRNSPKDLDRVLLEKTKKLVDLLKFRAEEKGAVEAIQSLKEEVFEIKLGFFKTIDSSTYGKIDKSLWEFAWEVTNTKSPYEGLRKALMKSLNAYSKLIAPIGGQIEGIFNEDVIKPSLVENIPSYSEIPLLLRSLLPAIKLPPYILEWLDTSLFYEIAIMLGDMVLNKEVELSKKEINKLSKFVLSNIEDFLFYTGTFGIYKPLDEDEDQIVRNVKIRLALHEAEKQQPQRKYTQEEVKNFILG